MQLRVQHNGRELVGVLAEAIDLSRPVRVGGGTSAFGLGHAAAEPVDIGGGRRLATREGGSVNCFDLTCNAHGHGTHTESVRHITDDGPNVDAVAPIGWMVARVVWLRPVPLRRSGESYLGSCDKSDKIVSGAALLAATGGLDGIDALVIGTEPYHRHEAVDFSGKNPAYLSAEAAAVIAASDVQHLVVDLPSIDREDDGGTTPNHRAFWGLKKGERASATASHPQRTITELVCLPADVEAGIYALSLQVAPIASDAAPSRPVLVPLRPASSSASDSSGQGSSM